MMRAVVLVLDLLLPGAGSVLAGRALAGGLLLSCWVALVAGVASGVALGLVDPVPAALAVLVGWTALEVLAALGPPSSARRPAFRALAVAVAAALGAFGLTAAVIASLVEVVAVPDLSAFPGLLPGEWLLVRRADFTRDPPAVGDLVFARTGSFSVLARVAGLGGDLVDVAGPSLSINGVVVDSSEEGEIQVVEHAGLPEEETSSLYAWTEVLGSHRHLVFYRRGADTLPTRQQVPAGRVFLIADNRSTPRAVDSRALSSVPLRDLVGRPVQVIWSPGMPRRIGFRWP